jgi:hypothetical protein
MSFDASYPLIYTEVALFFYMLLAAMVMTFSFYVFGKNFGITLLFFAAFSVIYLVLLGAILSLLG